MGSLIIAIVTLALAVVGLIVAITRHVTKVETLLTEIRKERPMVKSIPVLTYRVGFIENHLNLRTPAMPHFAESQSEAE